MSIRLGQHFLKNTSAIHKIIASLDIKNDETVIEIGPGTGALTFPLAEECKNKNCKLIAIEKDTELAKFLGEHFQFSNPNFQIIKGDVLKILPGLVCKLKIVNWKLVGNIPYYITGKLLRTISELKNKPELTVLMIQKEVAERIVAIPPKTNLLSAATQFWADPEIILKLKPNDFDPAPEVDSAIIRLTTNNKQQTTQKEIDNYYKLIRIIFKQPRKTLLNNLKNGLGVERDKLEKIIKSLGLEIDCRPQNLTVDDIIQLSQILTLKNFSYKP